MAKDIVKAPPAAPSTGCVRHRVVTATIRFDVALPSDLPKESYDEYAVERVKKICGKLNALKGLGVEYTLQ